MKDMIIFAGIVLYNPNVNRLKENINAIKTQVKGIVLVENGSDSDEYLKEFIDDSYIVIKNESNKGIAYALNQILSYCYNNTIPWVITLDQDSIVSNNIIEVYKDYIADDVGIVCPKVIDRNFKRREDDYDYDIKEISWCITSASLTNVDAWYSVGGFDNSMFIDWVDLDFCIALRKHGYKVLQTMRTHILHELGANSRIKLFRGREIYLLNRPAFRYYYVIRNNIYIGRKYESVSLKGKLREVFETMIFVLIYESNKWRNFVAMQRGLIDGLRMKIRSNCIEQFINKK